MWFFGKLGPQTSCFGNPWEQQFRWWCFPHFTDRTEGFALLISTASGITPVASVNPTTRAFLSPLIDLASKHPAVPATNKTPKAFLSNFEAMSQLKKKHFQRRFQILEHFPNFSICSNMFPIYFQYVSICSNIFPILPKFHLPFL